MDTATPTLLDQNTMNAKVRELHPTLYRNAFASARMGTAAFVSAVCIPLVAISVFLAGSHESTNVPQYVNGIVGYFLVGVAILIAGGIQVAYWRRRRDERPSQALLIEAARTVYPDAAPHIGDRTLVFTKTG